MFSRWSQNQEATTSTNTKKSETSSSATNSISKLPELKNQPPTSKLLRNHLINSSKALTSTTNVEVLCEDNRNIKDSESINNNEIALSRPTSTYSNFTDTLNFVMKGSRYRSQSVKDGLQGPVGNIGTGSGGSRPSSVRNGRLSRLSLVSNLNQHLLLSNNKNNSLNDSLNNSDSLSDQSQLTKTYEPSPLITSPTTSIYSPNLYSEEPVQEQESSINFEPELNDTNINVDGLIDKIEIVSNTTTNKQIKEKEEAKYLDEEFQFQGKDLSIKLEEDKLPNSWKSLKKHWLILSSAGKPIYTRYGDESKLSNLTGIIQAIVSFYLDDKDSIRSINLTDFKVIFMLRDPLYYVIISWLNEPEELLRDQLYIFHHQLLSILTASQLSKAFQRSNNFDLRRLLAGTEPFLDSLCTRLDGYCPSYLMEGIRVVRMDTKFREKVARALKPDIKPDIEDTDGDDDGDILYIVLSSKYRLIHLLRSTRASLHPTDLHTLFNALNSSQTFRIQNQTSYLPICFPKFNQSGYLYALITSVDLENDIILTILSPNKERYEKLTNVKLAILERLTSLMPQLKYYVQNDGYEVTQLNLPGLRHFLYKSNTLLQLTSTNFSAPYIPTSEQSYLFDIYKQVSFNSKRRFKPLRIIVVDTTNFSVLSWNTNEFQLLMTVTPYLSKSKVVEMALKTVKFVKKEFDSLFINKVEFLK